MKTRDSSCRSSFLAGLGIILAGLSHSALADEDSDSQVFGTIAQGWRANRESFQSFSCRFIWKWGYVDNIEAAFSGNLGDPITYEGLWIVDGPLVRYELICDPKVLVPAMDRVRRDLSRKRPLRSEGSQSAVMLPCSTSFYLKNSTIRARQSKSISSVNLIPLDQTDWAGIRITPFALDSMGADEESSPAAFLRGVVDGRFIGRFEGVVDLRGTAVLDIRLGLKGEPFRMGYRFDPQRGYLPLHFWDSDPKTGKKQDEVFILDIKECSNGRWFPTRAIVILGDSEKPGRKAVREMKVVALDVDHRPDPKVFYLDIPADTQVSVVNSHYYAYTHKDERVYADQLEDLYRRCVEHGDEQKRREALLLRPAGARGGGSGSGFWLILVNGGILGLVGFMFARRLARRRVPR